MQLILRERKNRKNQTKDARTREAYAKWQVRGIGGLECFSMLCSCYFEWSGADARINEKEIGANKE